MKLLWGVYLNASAAYCSTNFSEDVLLFYKKKGEGRRRATTTTPFHVCSRLFVVYFFIPHPVGTLRSVALDVVDAVVLEHSDSVLSCAEEKKGKKKRSEVGSDLCSIQPARTSQPGRGLWRRRRAQQQGQNKKPCREGAVEQRLKVGARSALVPLCCDKIRRWTRTLSDSKCRKNEKHTHVFRERETTRWRIIFY